MKRIFKLISPFRFAVLFVLLVVQAGSMLLIPTIAADIIDYGVSLGDIEYVKKYGVIMLIVAAVGFIAAVFNVYLSATESQGVGTQLREKLFNKIMFFSNQEIDRYGTSTLMTRTTSDVLQIQQFMMFVLRLAIIDPLRIIFAAVLAYLREPQLTFIFIIIVPILVILIRFILKKVSPLFRSLQVKTDRINRVFREGLTGIRVIRAFRKEEYEENRFNEANEDYKETSLSAHVYMASLMPLMILLASSTSILIIYFGSQLISTGEMEVGNLIAFISYAMNILMGIMMLSMIVTMLPRVQVAIERVYQIIDTPQGINDPTTAIPTDKHSDTVTLEFDEVDFRYPGAEKLALENINFSMKQGDKIAIIGGTGAGKSTLSRLLLRLYDIESGSIRIDGVDIRQFKQAELRQLLGFSPQEAVLFSGTIRENLQYGKADATDDELWHALKVAQGFDFVSNLPGGLDARVEQGGSNFSGGQRQRLSIARALVTDAKILVFDDSFSALDFKTDAQLRKALTPETRDKAVLIIAQRISTVVDADQILVLEHGQLVGSGTHEELKETNAVYKEIIDSQMRGDEL
ncbi:MAG TPA: ABC transporter ATP-binding protein [Atopostipes sp.]|nr:ABC transporter ATP-binding protein [Atopostipes sp.]